MELKDSFKIFSNLRMLRLFSHTKKIKQNKLPFTVSISSIPSNSCLHYMIYRNINNICDLIVKE